MKPIFLCTTLLSLALVAACATAPATHVVATDSKDCVVLLHGLNRSWRAMEPLAEALQQAGFSTVNVDYPSQLGTIEELAPVAVNMGAEACRQAGADILVSGSWLFGSSDRPDRIAALRG